jgi:glucose uptake protein
VFFGRPAIVFIVQSSYLAVIMCVLTMLCWGSWANTQKLASKEWSFELYYWDYSVGVLLLALLFALTLGSIGGAGRGFIPDMQQAHIKWLGAAFLGGAIFNLGNILLVAAIDIAGMAVAFPVGVGLALVLGVITTYALTGVGNVLVLTTGVGAVVLAILLDALAYRRLATTELTEAKRHPWKGIGVSVLAGLLMGWFYSFVAASMATITIVDGRSVLEPAGKLTPYTALVLFSVGLLASSFLWNSIMMKFPISGSPVAFKSYFTRGSARLHTIGIFGGMIWSLGMCLNVIASTKAGAALAYGLGQGATLIGALWGVFVWHEFRKAPKGTNILLVAMFGFYVLGLGVLIVSKL